MKKFFTLFAMGCLLAGSASAAQQSLDLCQKMSPRPELMESNICIDGITLRQPVRSANPERMPAKAGKVTPIITEVSGVTKNYNKSCAGTYFLDDIYQFEGDYGAEIVFGDNNEVYFYNLFSTKTTNSYAKGTKQGNKITMELPQTLAYYDAYAYGLNAAVLKSELYEEGGVQYMTYRLDNSVTKITFTIADDGTITLDPIDEPYDGYNMPKRALGIVYTDDDEWNGNLDFTQVYTPYDVDINEMPEGLTTEPYALVYGSEGHMVNVAIDGDKVYFQGFAEVMPESVIIGTLDKDNIVTITQNQVTGIYASYFIYTKVLYLNPDYNGASDSSYYILAPEDVTFKLKYNAEAKLFESVDPNAYFCLNALTDEIFYLKLFKSPYLIYQNGFEGTPAAPYELAFNEASVDAYGYYSFYFFAPKFSNKRTLLVADNLYYRIYVDDELMTFEETDGYDLMGVPTYMYQGFKVPTTQVPCAYDNMWDIVVWSDGMHEVGLYKEGITTVGVDIVYNYNGKTTYSNKMTLNVKTGEVTAGVDDVLAATVKNVEYYNLNGIKVVNPENGLYIKRVTLSDGTVKTSKVALR